MTTSPPTTPDRGQKKKVRSVAVRTSPRNLATKRKRVVGAGKTKVSKKIVARKALKVKPNLGRAGGSKEHNAKKKTAATPPVEEVKEDDDDNDEEDVGASAVDDNDDDDDDDDEFHVEDCNEEDEDDSADSAPDPIVESEGEEDDSSDDEEIPRTPDRRGTQTASFYKRNSEKMNSRMNKGGGKGGGLAKKPRSSRVGDPTDCQTASKSARPSESSGVDLDQMQLVHAYTRKESARYREPHVTTRVSSYVKNVMFRKIKFVNSEIMIQRAMNSLFKFENVKEHKKLHFHRVYETVFNDALNTKRSACEQAGGKIVKAALQSMGPDRSLFTVEELCKLRRSTTEREIHAFYWFFSTFLECVCGKKAWGSAKYNNLVSNASLSGATAGKIVTVSDEAFALLVYENYVDKWIKAAAKEEEEDTTEAGRDNQKKNKAAERMRGMYTGATAKSGQCKFGGWNRDGMVRFNELFALVKEDRASPQATVMERKLLEFCRSIKPGTDGDGALAEDQGGEAAARKHAAFEPPVEAMWDDDVEELQL